MNTRNPATSAIPQSDAAANGLYAVRSSVAGVWERTVRSTRVAEAAAKLRTLGIMRSVIVISLFLLCGCASGPHAARHISLDGLLADPKYADEIKQAESDPHNNVRPTTMMILAEIQPELKQMSVTELIQSLKVVPYPAGILTNDFSLVRDDVYSIGNLMITKEIKSRPKKELEVLPGLADDSVAIWTGPDGPVMTLTDFVRYDVYDK